MSRRRKTVDDLDALLPNELIETSAGSTVGELKTIVTQLESQMEEMIDKYENKIQQLTDRLESIETDFKQVVDALSGAGGGGSTGPPAPPG
ncbi:MAG: hypothetical protein IH840_07525 [Candidatus Heimdallarchaeota archaeon]|nr:hypothetical protein [Candidatus Heimdallarchaeota archaeon]